MPKDIALLKMCVSFLIVTFFSISVYSDVGLDELIKSKAYTKAIAYSNQKLPVAKRTVDEWIQIALAHEKAGSSADKIEAAYKGAQKVNPSDSRLYLGLANFKMKSKKYSIALKLFQRSYIFSRTAKAAEGIALSAFNLKQMDKARDAAESAIGIDPKITESRIVLYKIYLGEKDYTSAAEQLEIIVKKFPLKLKYWNKLAFCYEKLGNNEKLALVDPNIIKLNKRDTKSRLRHASFTLTKGDKSTSYALYKELAILIPNKKEVFENLFKIANGNGNKKDAVLYLKDYLRLDSTNANYNKELANLLYSQKSIDDALIYYRRVAKIAPKTKGIYKNYSEITIKKSFKKETVKVVKAADLIGEADARMLIALADIYKDTKKYLFAISYYNKALKTDVKNMDAMRSLAKCQAISGKVTNAIITYEQIVMLDPKSVVEHKALGDLNLRLKKSDKTVAGMKAYKTYLKKKPSDGAVAIKVGLNAFGQKKYKEAIQYLTMVKDKALFKSKYLESLGLSFYYNKDYANVVKYLSALKAKKPSQTVQKRFMKELAISYEEIGKNIDAANAYSAYTKLPKVFDKDASYKKAFLIENTLQEKAVEIYLANTKLFTKDFRNFLRLGIIYSTTKGKYGTASTMLSKASTLQPKDTDILRELARIYAKRKKVASELVAYKKLLALIPDDKEANKRVGTILIGQKSYTAGIVNLEMVFTTEPKNVNIMLLLAEGYTKTKRPEKAAILLAKAKALKSNDVKIRLDLIKAYEAANKKDKVSLEKASLAELDKKIVAKNAKNISARVRLADYTYGKKDFKTAYAIYKQLSTLTPKEKIIFKRLQEISLKNGNKKESVTYLKSYLKLDPKNAKAYKELGNLQYALKDMGGALASYRLVSTLDPSQKGYFLNYGKIVVKKGLADEAIKILKKAIANKEDDSKTHLVLANIYKKKRMYKAAIPLYNKASQNDPKNISILSYLGECQVKTNQVSAAVVTYEQAVMMNPNASSEYKEIGNLKIKQGKKSEAIKAYKKYLAKSAGDSKIAKIVGLYEYDKKNSKEAIKYLSMVNGNKLKDSKYLLSLGLAYYNEKNYKSAIANFEFLKKRKVSVAISKAYLKELGDSYEQLKNPLSAANSYRDYTKIKGIVDKDASYKSAFLREDKEKANAITVYVANTKKFPKDFRNFLRLGLIYSSDKTKYSLSASMLNKASLLKPKDATVLKSLAEVYGKAKNLNKELSTYKKYLIINPADLKVNRRVGVILSSKKQYAKAIINLEMVVIENPKDIEVLLLLAKGYSATKRPEKAIKYLNKAAVIKTDDVKITTDQYLIYKQIGRTTEAEVAVKKLISITKKNSWRVAYADDLILAKKLDEASKVVASIIGADPSSLKGLMLRGKIQQAQGKLDEATETYKMISFIKDGYAPMLIERGNIYLKQNKLPRALSFFNKAIATEPKNALAYLGLARLAKVQKKSAIYTKNINKAKSLDPNNPEIKKEISSK